MTAPTEYSTPQNALQSASEGKGKRQASRKGKALPQYPDDGKRYRRPTSTQIANALAAPRPDHWVNIWLRRLAVLDPSRYSALRAAFADKGKAGLHAVRYVSVKPCRKCGGTERFAVMNQCAVCNKAVRYGLEPKTPEPELIKREQKAQAKASAAAAQREAAGFPGGWMFMQDAGRTVIIHPVKTRSRPVVLTRDNTARYMLDDAQFNSLYQWACNGAAVPAGAAYQAG